MEKAKTNRNSYRRGTAKRVRGVQRVGVSVAGLTRGLLARQGFAQADVVTRWPEIVGAVLARQSVPERLVFPRSKQWGEQRGGTLHVAADSAFALELQHLAPEVIQRINSYYGFEAVSRLKITQIPVALRRRKRKAPPAPLLPDDRATLTDCIAPAKDKGLKSALFSLGEAVFTQGKHG